MYFPKLDEIYGSELIYLKADKPPNQTTIYQQTYKMTKTHWKAVDTPEKRCDESDSTANTTQCITSYFEHTIGCSMGLAGSNKQIAM